MSEQFKILNAKEEMLQHFSLIQQLQPDLTLNHFSECLDLMLPMGYQMIVLYQNEEVLGLTGIWMGAKLYCGKYIEIDNLIIDKNHRNKKVGKKICDYVEQLAIKNKCKVVMLDAYTSNTDSHRFYLRENFVIKGFHFLKAL